jgi:hypothetical protein
MIGFLSRNCQLTEVTEIAEAKKPEPGQNRVFYFSDQRN